ncbi:helix-turn-helix domain-containing protein [Streptomyces silaceus]|uniref:PucR family transcriptional regulator n=1 Tax=Streptomyces silaceus TaxID=545123 RepID=UPI0006EBB148|nr:helix-turn-helix domain-containing protein [Streptomyces silaceus]
MTTALAHPHDPAPHPHELRRLLGLQRPAAVEEMTAEVAARLPRYTDAFNRTRGYSVHRVVDRTVGQFMAGLGDRRENAARPRHELALLYEDIGAQHALRGCPLDGLREALGMAGQVARRRLIKDAYRFAWPGVTLGALIESSVAVLETAAASATRGYALERGGPAAELAEHRDQLREALVADPPVGRRPLAELAGDAAWPLPDRIAVLALPPGTDTRNAILPAEVLAHHHASLAYLVLPADEPPGARRSFPLLRTQGAALGPSVPLGRGAASLRWARHGVDLVRRGRLPARAPLRCADHLSVLAASRSGDLLEAASPGALGPLLALPRRRRDPLLKTLFAYLDSGDNAVVTAGRVFVHEQTVRYRLRQISRLTDGALPNAENRLETMLVLTWLLNES